MSKRRNKLLSAINVLAVMVATLSMTAAQSPSNAAAIQPESQNATETYDTNIDNSFVKPVTETYNKIDNNTIIKPVTGLINVDYNVFKNIDYSEFGIDINQSNNTNEEIDKDEMNNPSKVEIEPEILAEIKESKIVLPVSQRDKNRVPDYNTNVMYGEPYQTITDHTSQQWRLQCDCYTDEDGLRCYTDGVNKYYSVALGSAYGRTIGDTFRVTLKCGIQFNVIYADFKDDGTTDFFGPTHDDEGNLLMNYDNLPAMDLLEFIYDANSSNNKWTGMGMVNALPKFGSVYGTDSNIVAIEHLGQKWFPRS